MKKLAVSLILGASLAVAPSVFAMTAMTDSGLKAATGQAGVSIALDNIQIEEFTGETMYTDDDGTMGTAGTAGSIVISDRHTLKGYYALPNDQTGAGNDFYKQAFAAHVVAMGGTLANTDVLGTITNTSALTIDVGTCPSLSLGNYLNSTGGAPDATTGGLAMASATDAMTGVVIGLPTLLITTTADSYSVGVAAGTAGATSNDGAKFISISQGASAMAILSGTVEIAAH
jgi:hypothetical protein